jgi:large subunit ribosomal protein L4
MKTKVYTQDGTPKGEMDLPDEVFGADINEHLLYLVVKAYQANQRQGTAKTKGRSEVSGSGSKPWRQKGTGRARSGRNTSPVWVRGGKAFGSIPRDYGSTIPRKMRRKALRCALSSRARDEKVFVIDSLSMEEPKTKSIAALLKALSVADTRTLLVTDGDARNVFLSGRNVKNLNVKAVDDMNALDVLNNENIIFGAEGLVDKVKEAVTQ